VNSVVDSALGHATNEIGPRWRQRQPVPINRWQTLLIKWTIIAALTAVCAASVGAGTIALFAVAGSYGQLIALLVFVYAGLASAGGTVPVQALPGFLRTLSSIEPLRQVLAGTRSILYFGAQGNVGLTRGTLAAALGLVFWLAFGTAIVKWYDRKHLYRLQPDLLAHVSKSVRDYKTQHAAPAPTSATQSPSGQVNPGEPQKLTKRTEPCSSLDPMPLSLSRPWRVRPPLNKVKLDFHLVRAR
jgi:type IV secretory pathway TrbD component